MAYWDLLLKKQCGTNDSGYLCPEMCSWVGEKGIGRDERRGQVEPVRLGNSSRQHLHYRDAWW